LIANGVWDHAGFGVALIVMHLRRCNPEHGPLMGFNAASARFGAVKFRLYATQSGRR